MKNLFMCLPKRMATKAVFDSINQAYGLVCDKVTNNFLDLKNKSTVPNIKSVFVQRYVCGISPIDGYKQSLNKLQQGHTEAKLRALEEQTDKIII